MSLTYTCDLCGAMIDRETAYVTLNGNGDRAKDFWRTRGTLATITPTQRSAAGTACWRRSELRDAPALDAIPTATHQSITARRRKHRPLEPDDGIAPPA